MPIDQVAELLARWRGADGVMGRARLLREGMQLLGGLDAAERRMLARSLGEQGAPVLAERLEGRPGGALTSEQLYRVVSGLMNLEDDQIDRLAASLRDPAERDRLGREAVTRAAGSFDLGPRAGSDHRARLDELPPPGVSRGGAAGHSEVDTDRLGPGHVELGGVELGGAELGDAELGDQALGTAELVDAGIVDVGIVDVGLHQPEAASRALDRATDGEPTLPDRLATLTPEGGSGSIAASPSPGEGAGDGSNADEADHGPHDEAGADAAALLGRLQRAETAMARLRFLDREVLARLDGAAALAVLDALPDGWQRRRGALGLVDAGAFPTQQLADALARFARVTDAAFVAGALLAADQVRAERFEGILPERVVHRLVARGER